MAGMTECSTEVKLANEEAEGMEHVQRYRFEKVDDRCGNGEVREVLVAAKNGWLLESPRLS
ncbi:hypothetical protein HPP92_019176 [Vanilla planifolia]|nr:hypothetical protein HPP92_019176 [Vanilla planifolia]